MAAWSWNVHPCALLGPCLSVPLHCPGLRPLPPHHPPLGEGAAAVCPPTLHALLGLGRWAESPGGPVRRRCPASLPFLGLAAAPLPPAGLHSKPGSHRAFLLALGLTGHPGLQGAQHPGLSCPWASMPFGSRLPKRWPVGTHQGKPEAEPGPWDLQAAWGAVRGAQARAGAALCSPPGPWPRVRHLQPLPGAPRPWPDSPRPPRRRPRGPGPETSPQDVGRRPPEKWLRGPEGPRSWRTGACGKSGGPPAGDTRAGCRLWGREERALQTARSLDRQLGARGEGSTHRPRKQPLRVPGQRSPPPVGTQAWLPCPRGRGSADDMGGLHLF